MALKLTDKLIACFGESILDAKVIAYRQAKKRPYRIFIAATVFPEELYENYEVMMGRYHVRKN